MAKITCFNCGGAFYGSKNKIFCSKKCRYNYYHPQIKINLNYKDFSGIKDGKINEIRFPKNKYWERIFNFRFQKSYNPQDEKPKFKFSKTPKDIIFISRKLNESVEKRCWLEETENHFIINIKHIHNYL